MSVTDFAQNWEPYRDALLSRFPGLTEDDLRAADGSTADLTRHIAHRTGVADLCRVERQLCDLLRAARPARPRRMQDPR